VGRAQQLAMRVIGYLSGTVSLAWGPSGGAVHELHELQFNICF